MSLIKLITFPSSLSNHFKPPSQHINHWILSTKWEKKEKILVTIDIVWCCFFNKTMPACSIVMWRIKVCWIQWQYIKLCCWSSHCWPLWTTAGFTWANILKSSFQEVHHANHLWLVIAKRSFCSLSWWLCKTNWVECSIWVENEWFKDFSTWA